MTALITDGDAWAQVWRRHSTVAEPPDFDFEAATEAPSCKPDDVPSAITSKLTAMGASCSRQVTQLRVLSCGNTCPATVRCSRGTRQASKLSVANEDWGALCWSFHVGTYFRVD